ncbi:UDP-N-acetylmuramate--L-alanine ligase [Bifidobacterium aemilianum]|uniref:UDP-N-acetylmuramate--L-alanine ligase n=1 Tax=Bifidobacterium aemilianum TaxID=2493120 RepID=A0A366KBI3_9BIFI|nr:UDP-N-acetylmuramate--L-alanine ligase [Bifidobacterium aemilianum]RBP98548.1 UDP-N-acetylmuramate--L-alanine ligase [Bifidobacterium aemilianum]
MSERKTASKDGLLVPEQPAFGPGESLKDLGPTHFIGIGGAGMSVLAEMLHEEGIVVSGSDSQASARTDRLQALGITVNCPQQARNVAGAHTVVYSSAIKADNPEIQAALQAGARIVHRSDILALLMAGHRSVSVAGAHGKTTTSSLLAHILIHGGQGQLADPSYAIGASIQGPDGRSLDGGHAGKGTVLVAEADESDGSFLKYHPSIAIVTNAQADHLDHYGTAEHYRQAFVDHLGHARDWIIMGADDQGSLDVLQDLDQRALSHTILYSTGTVADLPQGLADQVAGLVGIRSERESQGSGRESFTLEIPGKLLAAASEVGDVSLGSQSPAGTRPEDPLLPVSLAIPGLHNARNASEAIMAAILLGMDPAQAAGAAESFLGASRRFDLKGQRGGVSVVDDYAHHPTEISALLDAARRRYPNSSIRVLFQPHLFSRTQIFARDFAKALAKADDVIVTGIYPARERQEDFPGVGPRTIVDQALALKDSHTTPGKASGSAGGEAWISAVDDMTKAAGILAGRARPGDLLLTVGAGSITAMGPVLLDLLQEDGGGHGRQGSEGEGH